MYQYNDILSDLKKLGITEKDTLMVHSSMKAVGRCVGGADTVVDALMDAVCEGLLVLPTHTWATMTEEHTIYDREKEPACVGIIPNVFRKRERVYRSLHPTHSVAAWGKDAEKFIEGEENHTTPCSRSGCYGKIYGCRGKIMLLGCGLNRNTYMHGIEEWFGIRERLTEYTLPLQVVMPDRTLKLCQMHKHFKPNGVSISEHYEKLKNPLIEQGILKMGNIGDAQVLIMDAVKTADFFTDILQNDRDAFLDEREVCTKDKVLKRNIKKQY